MITSIGHNGYRAVHFSSSAGIESLGITPEYLVTPEKTLTNQVTWLKIMSKYTNTRPEAVMALRFIGIDPETAGGNCPSVWVDEASGDLLFQGWEVTDRATLDEVAAKSPIAAHEKIVRLPARMRAIIQEATSDGAADLR